MLERAIYILITGFLVVSCEKSVRIADDKKIRLEAFDNLPFEDASTFVDTANASVVVLGESEIPVEYVDKLREENGYLYLLDRNEKAIFQFDSLGRNTNIIRKVGHARNEYTDITDFDISNDSIFILDQNLQAVKIYSCDGKFIGNIDISKYWANFISVNGGYIYLFNNCSDCSAGKFRVFCLDIKGNLVAKHIPFTMDYGISSDNVVCKQDGYYLFCAMPDNSVYKVKNDSVSLLAYLDFGNKEFPKEYHHLNLREILAKRLDESYVLGLDAIYSTGRYLVAKYRFAKETQYAIIDLETNAVVQRAQGFKVNGAYKMGLSAFHVDNGYVYNIYPAETFISIYDNVLNKEVFADKYKAELKHIRETIEPLDNPVIVKYKLK